MLQTAGRGAPGYVLTPGGLEVDFLATLPDGQQWLVQVCHDLTDPQTLAREVRALQDAQPAHPHARCCCGWP